MEFDEYLKELIEEFDQEIVDSLLRKKRILRVFFNKGMDLGYDKGYTKAEQDLSERFNLK